MKWTISRKIGGLAALLIAFIILILLYSIYVVRGIEAELAEMARYELPLAELATDIEVAQLEQNIQLEKLLLAATSGAFPGAGRRQLERLKEYSGRMEAALAEGLSLTGTRLADENDPATRTRIQTTRDRLAAMQTGHAAFHDRLQRYPAVHPVALQQAAEELDRSAVEFVKGIEATAGRQARLIARQERAFFLVNVTLGCAAVLLGTILSVIVVMGIRSRIHRLTRGAEQVTEAIITGQSLPADALSLEADDEFAELSRNLSRLVEQFSEDISRRAQLAARLETLATTDPLTGAFNRYKWEQTVAAELSRLAARPFDLSVIMFDIDHFKKVNDRFGHDAGDLVLKHTVERTRKPLRELDDLFRMGGEEFVVLARYSDTEDARQLAELLRQEVGAFSFPEAGRVTLSLGVATYRTGQSADEMLKAADLALYRAKEGGRNRVEVAED